MGYLSNCRHRVSGPGLGHQEFHKTARHSLSTDSDTVDEQAPSVHDRPPAQRRPPHGSQHDQPEEHDQRVLDQTEFAADPVSFETNGDLADHDTDDLEVGLLRVGCMSVFNVLSYTNWKDDSTTHSSDPVLVTCPMRAPAVGPDGLEERGQVSDGEQGVTFGEQTETVEDVSSVEE